MLVKVITLISLASMGNGKLSPVNDDLSSKQAVSSQSYHRGDVPLSYQFSQVHIYSTPEPEAKSNQKHQHHSTPGDSRKFLTIQYAPLLKPDEQRYQNGLQPKAHSPHDILAEANTKTSVRKDHLEPKLPLPTLHNVLPHAYKPLEYVPGHNIEVLQGVYREPAHNSVYRSYPNRMQGEKYNVKYVIIRDNNTSQTTKSQVTTTTPTTTTRPTRFPYKTTDMKYEFIIDQYYGPKHNRHQLVDFPVAQQALSDIRMVETRAAQRKVPLYNIEKNPQIKLHSLLLNVARAARAYNLAVTPYKNPSDSRSSDDVRRLPSHQQLLLKVPGAAHQLHASSPELKTLLYPVQNNLLFAHN